MGVQLPPYVLEKLEENDLPLLIASQTFKTFRRLCDRLNFNQSDQSYYMRLDEFEDVLSETSETSETR